MIEITITIDEIIWPEMYCGRFCKECFKDEQRKESDDPVFRSGIVRSYFANGKGRPFSRSSGSHERNAKREYAQRIYQRKMPDCRSGERIEKNPAATDANGNDAGADINVFEEDLADGSDTLLRYLLYGVMQGAAGCKRSA